MFDSSGKKQNNKSFIFLVTSGIRRKCFGYCRLFNVTAKIYVRIYQTHCVLLYTRSKNDHLRAAANRHTTFVRSIPEEYMYRDRIRPAVHKRGFRQPCNRRKIHVTVEISITGFVKTTWPVDPSKYINNVPKHRSQTIYPKVCVLYFFCHLPPFDSMSRRF